MIRMIFLDRKGYFFSVKCLPLWVFNVAWIRAIYAKICSQSLCKLIVTMNSNALFSCLKHHLLCYSIVISVEFLDLYVTGVAATLNSMGSEIGKIVSEPFWSFNGFYNLIVVFTMTKVW